MKLSKETRRVFKLNQIHNKALLITKKKKKQNSHIPNGSEFLGRCQNVFVSPEYFIIACQAIKNSNYTTPAYCIILKCTSATIFTNQSATECLDVKRHWDEATGLVLCLLNTQKKRTIIHNIEVHDLLAWIRFVFNATKLKYGYSNYYYDCYYYHNHVIMFR